MTSSVLAQNLDAMSTFDSDHDGLPDDWERAKVGNLLQLGTDDADGDGLTNLQEYVRGSDPTQADADKDSLTDPVDPYPYDFFNNTTPLLTVVSGDNQSGVVNQFNSLPLKISVFNAAGTVPFARASVTFTVLTGGGKMAVTNTGSPSLSASLSVLTAADGTAQVYYKQPAFALVTSQIKVEVSTAFVVAQSTSTGGPGDTDSDNLPDSWETTYFGNLGQSGSGDFDHDGVSNLEEFLAGTDPTKAPDPSSASTVKLSVWTPLK